MIWLILVGGVVRERHADEAAALTAFRRICGETIAEVLLVILQLERQAPREQS